MSMERRKQGRKIELLAPAGSREAFYGAVHAGADAIYMGGEKFGARAYADNFSREELITCIRYGHIHGRRSYLTANTLIKEQELAELMEALKPLYEAGLDGVIVQDIGALQVIRRHFPELKLHASTQMTVTGEAGAKLLRELGVSRVVPARELSLRELRRLKQESGLEVEAFVHGAMCYCYSGECLFSSFLGGRSGNRGRCAQPCRLSYDTDSPGASVHRKEYYPLSLKDLCTIEHLPELIEGGIDSLKIEGRMKKPEYAAGVTALYRKYIDRYLAHPEKPFCVEKEDLEALSKLYIRSQRQDGYFFRQNGREMVTLESPSYSGSDEAYLEQVRQRYIEQKKRLKIWMRAEFVRSSPARLQIGTGDCRAEVWGSVVESAQNRPILAADIQKQLQKLGETCFALESLDIHTDPKGFYPLKEINALRREAVRQLEDQIIAGHGLAVGRKTAPDILPPDGLAIVGTADDSTMVETADDPATAEPPDGPATAEKSAGNTKAGGTRAWGITAGETSPVRGLRVHISTEEQLLYLAEHLSVTQGSGPDQGRRERRLAINRLYVESCLLLKARPDQRQKDLRVSKQRRNEEKIRQALEGLRRAGTDLWAALPYILRSKDREIMENAMELYRQGKIQGFLVRNLEEYGWLQQTAEASWQKAPQPDSMDPRRPLGQAYSRRQIQLDHTVYVWNSQSAAFWREKGCGLTCPLELNAREWNQLLRRLQCSDMQSGQAQGGDAPEKLVYGRIPMMVTANCIARTAGKCLHGQVCRAEGGLTDRYHTRFPVEIRCDVCMNVIYNSVPLSLHKEHVHNVNKRLSFTTESGREMWRILDFYTEKSNTGASVPPYRDYTTGHEKKGVL